MNTGANTTYPFRQKPEEGRADGRAEKWGVIRRQAEKNGFAALRFAKIHVPLRAVATSLCLESRN